MAATLIPPPPDGIPDNARDIVPHEGNGGFLGWTFRTRHRFTLRTSYYAVRPDGTTDPARCATLLDAVNYLRGPAGLPALVNDHDS